MSEQIQKVDLSDASKKMRDKIKTAFSEILTDEQWHALIESELKRFISSPVKEAEYRNYGNRTERELPSEFAQICNDVFKREFKEKFTEYCKDEDFSKNIGKTVTKWLDENKTTLVQSVIMDLLKFQLGQIIHNVASSAASTEVFNHQQNQHPNQY